MEAARTLTSLPERMRRHRFGEACEELRPQGVAFVLKRFGGSLDRADAEDVVAEVIIRFDRLDLAGRGPDRLRPAFFQSVRNAALDLLRYRGVRPTAPLEAAEWQTADSPTPEDVAESHENLVRLREAMARMRPNYREAIVLRFGLGMTVPEIAAQVGISLPAAKKLVLRSTAQIRDRMEAIEDRSFCPGMREIAERSVLDGETAEIAEEAETAAIKAHLEHCGPCRSFLLALRSNLHELGGAALLGGLVSAKVGPGARLASHLTSAFHGAQAAAGRARLASYRLGGAFRAEGADSAGLLAGTGQKIAAVCTVGVAGAATCAATGIVGPGIGVAQHQAVHHPAPPPPHVRKASPVVHRPLVTYQAPAASQSEETSSTAPSPSAGTAPRPRHPDPSSDASTVHQAKPKPEADTESEAASTPEQTEESQFGIEGESSSAEPAPADTAAPDVEARTVESTPSPAPSSSASSTSTKSSSGGHV